MKLKSIVEGKSYPLIEERVAGTFRGGQVFDCLLGTMRYTNKGIESLDGNNHSLNDDYERYEEWYAPNTIRDGNGQVLAYSGDVCLRVYRSRKRSMPLKGKEE